MARNLIFFIIFWLKNKSSDQIFHPNEKIKQHKGNILCCWKPFCVHAMTGNAKAILPFQVARKYTAWGQRKKNENLLSFIWHCWVLISKQADQENSVWAEISPGVSIHILINMLAVKLVTFIFFLLYYY